VTASEFTASIIYCWSFICRRWSAAAAKSSAAKAIVDSCEYNTPAALK